MNNWIGLGFRMKCIVRLFFFLTVFFTSCKSKKQIQKSKGEIITTPTDAQNLPDSIDLKCKIDFKSAKSISSLLVENEFSYTSMLGRYEVKYDNGMIVMIAILKLERLKTVLFGLILPIF